MTMHLSQCMIAVQDHSTQGGQPSQEAAADQLPSEPSHIQSFVCALYRNVSCKPLLVHMSHRPVITVMKQHQLRWPRKSTAELSAQPCCTAG